MLQTLVIDDDTSDVIRLKTLIYESILFRRPDVENRLSWKLESKRHNVYKS
jgi:hypothetical protein